MMVDDETVLGVDRYGNVHSLLYPDTGIFPTTRMGERGYREEGGGVRTYKGRGSLGRVKRRR